MKYGNAELHGKFVLGPMAAYTDIAFRLLCRRAGAAMCFTEFANAEAITRGGKNTEALMLTMIGLARASAIRMPCATDISAPNARANMTAIQKP